MEIPIFRRERRYWYLSIVCSEVVFSPFVSLLFFWYQSHLKDNLLNRAKSPDERNFVHPEEWIPDRFTTRPELIHDQRAFVPWSAGKYVCIGKNLSLIEIRVAAALILKTFDMEFAPGEDGERMFTEALDYFTTTPGPLNVVLKERREVEI